MSDIDSILNPAPKTCGVSVRLQGGTMLEFSDMDPATTTVKTLIDKIVEKSTDGMTAKEVQLIYSGKTIHQKLESTLAECGVTSDMNVNVLRKTIPTFPG